MNKRECQRLIQARATESGYKFAVQKKINVLEHTAHKGNPFILEHDFIFTYDGVKYRQTSHATGYYSGRCVFKTEEIA